MRINITPRSLAEGLLWGFAVFLVYQEGADAYMIWTWFF